MRVDSLLHPPSGVFCRFCSLLGICFNLWDYGVLLDYGVLVSMFDFHRSDRGSNPGCGGKIS